jgi:hypothetical protein
MKRLLLSIILLFAFISANFTLSQQKQDKPKADNKETQVTNEQTDSTDILTAFSARIKDKKIHLVWRVTNPLQISYFYLQRIVPGSNEYETINKDRIALADFFDKDMNENSLPEYKYSYEDDPEADGVYYYRLRAYDAGSKLVLESDPIKLGISGIRDFVLEQNYPNPFNPTTTIQYELMENTHVTIKVYDLIGKEVTTLVDKIESAGKYTVEFDASKFSNLTSGIYFYKLQTEKYSDVKKMILNK